MIRIAAGVALALHGLIHLIGFVVPWRLADVEGFPYRTDALNGALELGSAGAAALGLAWLAVAIGFVVTGVGVVRRSRWATAATAWAAAVSLVLCALALPEAAAGLVIDVAILAVLAAVRLTAHHHHPVTA